MKFLFFVISKTGKANKSNYGKLNLLCKGRKTVTDGFKVGTGLRQGDGLAPSLFNIVLEYVIRQLLVQTTSTVFHRSVQLTGHANDINIVGGTKRAMSDVYGEVKERAKEVGLIINVDKTKAVVQNKRLRKG